MGDRMMRSKVGSMRKVERDGCESRVKDDCGIGCGWGDNGEDWGFTEEQLSWEKCGEIDVDTCIRGTEGRNEGRSNGRTSAYRLPGMSSQGGIFTVIHSFIYLQYTRKPRPNNENANEMVIDTK